jgi:uncharacterized protein
MFKRRTTRPFFQTFTEAIWPAMGWKRALAYYWHRLQRIPGSPESIAAGFACGAAASMMPLVGFHFLLSALLAWLLRSSILASAFGTAVGNPWTFPFIWLGTYELGQLFLGSDNALDERKPFRTMFSGLSDAIRTFDGQLFMEQVWPIWWPMMVGSLPVAVIVGFATYWLIVGPIRKVHDMRLRRAAARTHREQT